MSGAILKVVEDRPNYSIEDYVRLEQFSITSIACELDVDAIYVNRQR